MIKTLYTGIWLVHFIIHFSKTAVYECCHDYKNNSGNCEGMDPSNAFLLSSLHQCYMTMNYIENE